MESAGRAHARHHARFGYGRDRHRRSIRRTHAVNLHGVRNFLAHKCAREAQPRRASSSPRASAQASAIASVQPVPRISPLMRWPENVSTPSRVGERIGRVRPARCPPLSSTARAPRELELGGGLHASCARPISRPSSRLGLVEVRRQHRLRQRQQASAPIARSVPSPASAPPPLAARTGSTTTGTSAAAQGPRATACTASGAPSAPTRTARTTSHGIASSCACDRLRRLEFERAHPARILRADRGDDGKHAHAKLGADAQIEPDARDVPRMRRSDREDAHFTHPRRS